MAAHDQGFRAIGAKLGTSKGPYDPFNSRGSAKDDSRYIQEPGVNFMRPWLAIRNGAAFQWPLGLQGYSNIVDPTLGTHKFIGDNKVTIDVIHAGEEHFTLNGMFPGDSAPALVAALKDIVYKAAPPEGKILWLPEVVAYAQRVQVVHFEAQRSDDDRGRDMSYSIEFVRIGTLSIKFDTLPTAAGPQPSKPAKGKPARSIKVDATHNTLRKIAQWKLGGADKWRTIYNANQKWFVTKKVPLAKAPDYRLPLGLAIHY